MSIQFNVDIFTAGLKSADTAEERQLDRRRCLHLSQYLISIVIPKFVSTFKVQTPQHSHHLPPPSSLPHSLPLSPSLPLPPLLPPSSPPSLFPLSSLPPPQVKECLFLNIMPLDGSGLRSQMHARGINMRYLGRVAAIAACREDLHHLHVSWLP